LAARHVRQLLQLNTFQPDPWKNAMYSRILVPLDRSATAHHASGFEPPKVYIEEVRPGFLAAG